MSAGVRVVRPPAYVVLEDTDGDALEVKTNCGDPDLFVFVINMEGQVVVSREDALAFARAIIETFGPGRGQT